MRRATTCGCTSRATRICSARRCRRWKRGWIPNRFVRIHRSHIVNADRIKELQPGAGDHAVILRSGVKLPLSRGYKDRLQDRMGRSM